MKRSPLAGSIGAAALMVACAHHLSPSPGGDDGQKLHGICSVSQVPAEAVLGMFVSGSFGYTLPLPAGQKQQVTLTVLNSGSLGATQMVDLTPQSSALSYEGGTYPGAGGDCGTELAAGATCTLVVDVVAPATGRQTSLVTIQYYDGVLVTTDAHQVTAVAVTGSFATAPHAPLPPMPQNGGQAPLSSVDLVTVSFSDTPEDDQIAAFGDWIVTSSYWQTIGADYGVGAGTHQHVRLPDPTPTTVTDERFKTYVDEAVAAGALPSSPQSVYAFFLSPATTVTDVLDAGGWHNVTRRGHDYALILPGCSPAPADILNTYTFVAGHELAEAATDPAPESGYTFAFGEGEVGDLCDDTVVENGYTLPTIWSNTAAAAGGYPCAPATDLPYIDVDPSPAQLTIPATAGSSAGVTLMGWSTALVGDWLLEVKMVGPAASAFTATLD
ncbi:MAG TPA: hypothetical protein VIF09_24330, partial [Polyangiaceae bacterium]